MCMRIAECLKQWENVKSAFQENKEDIGTLTLRKVILAEKNLSADIKV